MSTPLEEHLRRLADPVEAPASASARGAIDRRVDVLRGRRRARNAMGGGLLVAAIVAGGMALRGVKTVEDQDGQIAASGSGLPAFSVEVDGWDVTEATDQFDHAPDPEEWILAGTDVSLQVFRRTGDLIGPVVYVTHSASSDAVVPVDGQESVAVGDAIGAIKQLDDSVDMIWNPEHGDSTATLKARGLSEDEAVAFAADLEMKDPERISFPPAPDAEFGFVPGELPDGLEEVTGLRSLGPDYQRDNRLLRLADGTRTIDVEVANGGAIFFEALLNDLLFTPDEVEQVTVLGHDAVLVHDGKAQRWNLVWRHTSDTSVRITLTGGDRATVDQIVDGLQEISEDEWDDIVAEHS
jgi:hypothetical protein